MTEYTLYDLSTPEPDMLQEVMAGFALETKRISPKYFYDERGSQLFDAITKLPEYYLTCTELDILITNKKAIADAIGPDSFLIEFGSGSSVKVRVLLESIRPTAYMPVDISKEHLENSVKAIAKEYGWLDIRATCVDYSEDFSLPWSPENARRIAFFPGSSLGNFSPEHALALLVRIRNMVGETGGLLIGIDKQKPEHILRAAYNDSAGVTEAFNLNMLEHINRVLDADFAKDDFKHEAIYNARAGRIEMYLRSLKKQQVRLNGHQLDFRKNERISTEHSYKYSTESFLEVAKNAGFSHARHWTDDQAWFSVFYLSP